MVYALSCKFDTNMSNGELFHIVTPAVCIELKICKTTIDALFTVFFKQTSHEYNSDAMPLL